MNDHSTAIPKSVASDTVANNAMVVSSPPNAEVSLNVMKPALATRISDLLPMTSQWKLGGLPTSITEPVPVADESVKAGEFLLFPERKAKAKSIFATLKPGRAFFATTTPRLLDCSLAVQAIVQQDGSVRITGGTAVLSLGVYAQEDLAAIARNQSLWTLALTRAGYGVRPWLFQPVNLRDLQAALELPEGHVIGAPRLSIDVGAGTATLIIDLTETGVLVWKEALEQHTGNSIPGLCRLTASYYGQLPDRVVARDFNMSAPLGKLLKQCGPDRVRQFNPQQTVKANLIVAGHDLLDRVVITMQPDFGQAPYTQGFGRDGGQVEMTITTQNLDAVTINWQAQVIWKTPGWPVIPAAGKFSTNDGWATIIKPDSWISRITVMALLVDFQGKPVMADSTGGNYRIGGALTLIAPWLKNGEVTTNFDAPNQMPVTVALPRLPDSPCEGVTATFEAPNQMPVTPTLPRLPDSPCEDLTLTISAKRDGKANIASRKLSSKETSVLMMIYPDSRIEIKTSQGVPM